MLLRLQLSERELAALCFQGFVSSEDRGNTTNYKLRFRVDGEQRVRYLGADERLALAVEFELNLLQRDVRRRRQRSKLGCLAAQRLKEAKHTLQPLVEAHGFHFHGLAIRKRRVPKLLKVVP